MQSLVGIIDIEMIDFRLLAQREKIMQALSTVLDVQLDNLKNDDSGLVSLYYRNLEQAIKMQNSLEMYHSLAKLDCLQAELNLAKVFFVHRQQDFQNIVRGLMSVEPGTSFGARAELMMLFLLMEDSSRSSLFSAGDIIKRESPDYSVRTLNGEIYLEVTSAHVHAPGQKKKKGTGYKVKRAIRRKSALPYVDRNTALFIDITNLIYREAEAYRDINMLNPFAERTLMSSKLGAVIVMYSLFSARGEYVPHYHSFTHPEASKTLAQFLTLHYLKGYDARGLYYATSTT